jgi:hypothetical protein
MSIIINLNKQIENINFKLDYKDIKSIKTDTIKIVDIKDYSDKDKAILTMFVNDYIHLNPTISSYSRYNDLLYNDIILIENVNRGFYVSLDIISRFFPKVEGKVLQISVLPTFIEVIKHLGKEGKFIKSDFKSYLNLPLISDKYDLIIFDTYKNIEHIDYNSIDESNDPRLFSAYIHFKYILKQIVFGINHLNQDGNMILLFPTLNIYNQFLIILNLLFDQVILYHSFLDYSYRYFVICKKFDSKSKYIKSLTDLKINNDSVLVSIITESIIYPVKTLDDKFINIYNKIKNINKYFYLTDLMVKIYYDRYHYQLFNSIKWLKSILNVYSNNNVDKLIKEYRKNLLHKFSNPSSNIYNIKLLETNKLNIVNQIINLDEFEIMFKSVKYISLIKYFIKDLDKINNNIINSVNIYSDDLGLNLENSEFIDMNNYIFSNKNSFNNLVIRFTIDSISPFFVSLLFIYGSAYQTIQIVKTIENRTNFYAIFKDKIYDIPKTLIPENPDKNMILVRISEEFIRIIDEIFKKLILSVLTFYNRLEYLFVDDYFITYYKLETRHLKHKNKKLII